MKRELMLGPSLLATFTVVGERLESVTLAAGEEEGFDCRIIGGSASTEEALLSWSYGYCRREALPFPLEIDLSSYTFFRQKVFFTLLTIPFGITHSYGEVAEISGYFRGARAVGSACGANKFPLVIPCHRVVAAQGAIGGFSFDIKVKERLLAFEAI